MQKNFFYYLLPSIVTGVLNALVMVPITTYYLNPEEFGVFAILSSITMPIGALASTGSTWVLAGNYYKIDEKERKILLFNVLILDFTLKLFWVLVFWLSAPLLLPFIIKEFELIYVFYFKLSLIATLLTSFWPSILYFIVLREEGHIHAMFEISQWGIGVLITTICLTILNLSTITLFLGTLGSGAISFIIGLWYMRKHVIPKISKKYFLEIFKVGMPSIPSNLFEIGASISDRYFIQRWLNLSYLGIYSHSASYKNIFTTGTKAFIKALSPSVLEVFSSNLDTKILSQQLKKWYGLIGVAGIFLTLFSKEIVSILTHGKFVAAAPLIPIWFMLPLSHIFGFPATQFLFVHKKTAYMVYSGIAIGIFFIGVAALFTYEFGMIGAGIAMVLSNFSIQLFRRFYARKLFCDSIGEKDFLYILILILATYIGNISLHPSISGKAFICLTIWGLIVHQYNLLSVIKTNGQRVVAYVTTGRVK